MQLPVDFSTLLLEKDQMKHRIMELEATTLKLKLHNTELNEQLSQLQEFVEKLENEKMKVASWVKKLSKCPKRSRCL